MGLFSGATNLFRGVGNVFNKQSGFTNAFGGGNWKDRFGARDGINISLPSPNIPAPGEKSLLPKLTEKFSEGLSALPGGMDTLGNNLTIGYKGLYNAIENPQKAYLEGLAGGNWRTRFGMGGSDDDSGGSSSSTSSSSSNEIPQNTTDLAKKDPEEERRRLDAIRRMLAGRYGRAETNLTGGKSYGSGAGRSIGGMSG